MRELWNKIKIILLFWKKPVPIKRRPYIIRDPSIYGFKKTILNRLGWYFKIIKRLKRGDKGTYALYSKFGGIILPEDIINDTTKREHDTLLPWWKENRPMFGAVFLSSGRASKDTLCPTFMCFKKYDKFRVPPEIQKAKGDIYVVTVCWDDVDNKRWKTGTPTEFAVTISEEGEVTVLKIKQRMQQVVQSKRGNFSIPKSKYVIHPFFKSWATDAADLHKERTTPEEREDYEDMKDINNFLRRTFITTANLHSMHHHEMTKIRVKRGNCVAVFSIDILRTPYFFQERDLTCTKNGRRKPIFHIVRTHPRVTKKGVQHIRTHFRGEKVFKWEGYNVSITVPGWDHADLAGLDVGFVDADKDDLEALKDTKDISELGDWLTSIEGSGLGGYKYKNKGVRHDK